MLKLHAFTTLICLMLVLLSGILARGRTIDEILAPPFRTKAKAGLARAAGDDTVTVELDMILTKEQYRALYSPRIPVTSPGFHTSYISKRNKRKAIRGEIYRWTNKEIPFTIDASFSDADQELITEAIIEWQKYTCLTFRSASAEDNNVVAFVDDYDDANRCESYIGEKGGVQNLTLHQKCRAKPVIIHEIGHAVGFYHEQSRPDRDNYITIHRENFDWEYLPEFAKYNSSVINTYDVPYDYLSVMHYGARAGSKNDQVTIETKDPKFQEVIGTANGLSFADIKLANLMYDCSQGCDQGIFCPGAGFLGKDCRCWCPENPVVLCDPVSETAPSTRPSTKPVTTTQPVTTIKLVTTTKPVTTTQQISTETSVVGWTTPAECLDPNDICSLFIRMLGGSACQTNDYVKNNCLDTCTRCGLVCQDQFPFCSIQKSMGWCSFDRVKNICKKTCGSCE